MKVLYPYIMVCYRTSKRSMECEFELREIKLERKRKG